MSLTNGQPHNLHVALKEDAQAGRSMWAKLIQYVS